MHRLQRRRVVDSLDQVGSFNFPSYGLTMSLRLPIRNRSARSSSRSMSATLRRSPLGKRSDWRIVRDVFVGETDAQARKDCLASGLVRATREYLLPLYRELQFTPFFKHDGSIVEIAAAGCKVRFADHSSITPQAFLLRAHCVTRPCSHQLRIALDGAR